jgi:hypothetical protein
MFSVFVIGAQFGTAKTLVEILELPLDDFSALAGYG